MTAKIISIKNNPTTFYMLLIGIVFFAVFYIYCVNSAVRNVVAREQAESRISALQAVISELELKYIGSENQMTLERAKSLGLAELPQKTYISKNSKGNSQSKPLSINKNR